MSMLARNRDRQGAAGQRGFALLIVFLIAAGIALMLYQQLPRVAFESERDKEQMLIDRGEQFKRAVQLYYIANKRYPSKIEDLENTNDKRYLRKRYIDPFTGKDEWRLIHTNGFFLTDSLVQKPPAGGTTNGVNNNQNAANTNTPPVDPNAPPDVNAAVIQRPSDRTLNSNLPQGLTAIDPNNQANFDPNNPTGQQQPNFQPGQQQPNFQQPGGFPGGITSGVVQGVQNGLVQSGLAQTGAIQGGIIPSPTGQGQFPPGLNPNFANGLPGGLPNGQQPPQYRVDQNGQLVAIQPGDPAYTTTSPNPNQGFPNQTFPNQGFPNQNQPATPGGLPANGANQAVNLINQLLTTPRQPPAGISVATAANQQPAQSGIVGVASTYKGATIKTYGERNHYNEWEFVFQLNQPGAPGQPNQNATATASGTTQNPSSSTTTPGPARAR